MTINRLALLGAGLLNAASAVSIASAQDAAPSGNWTPSSSEEVVVTGQRGITAPTATTATRTDTPIEEVAQSIQVLTKTLISDQEVRTLSDALVNVSGVTPTSTLETVLQSPIVRGFNANYYIDGLPAYGLPSGTIDPATLIGVERIEVAKGPASTLYGGGTGAPLGGLINVVSPLPYGEFGRQVSARAGSFDTYGITGDISVPFSETAGVRLIGAYDDAGSYIDVVESTSWSVFPVFAWEPANDTRVTLRGQFNRLEQLEYAGLPAELAFNSASGVDRFAFAGAENAPPTVVENAMGTLTLAHRFSDSLSAEVSGRLYRGTFDEFGTFPFPAVPVAGTTYNFASASLPTVVDQAFLTASVTAKFEALGASHTLLLGGDYDHTDYDASLGFGFIGLVDYADASTNVPFGTAPFLSDVQSDRMRSTALYIQDQAAVGDRLDITAGLRWIKLDIHSRYDSFGTTFVDSDKKTYRLVPRVGATYRIAEGVSVFAGYAEGFQGIVAAFGVDDPKPETSQSWEAGLKFFDTVPGLTGTLSLYQITRQNVVTPDPLNPFQSIQTGEQRAQGAEVDLVYEPDTSVSLLFSYAYTDAEVTEDNNLPVGDKLRRIPEHAARLAGRYRFQEPSLKGLELGLGLTAVSSRELTLPNSVSVDGNVLVDAQIAYDFGPAAVSLSIVNLTDSDAFVPYQYLARAVVAPVQPLSAFLTIKTSF
jgi:iron complex outermembrane receptor protein